VQPVARRCARRGSNEGNEPGAVKEVRAHLQPPGAQHQHRLARFALAIDEEKAEQDHHGEQKQRAHTGDDLRQAEDGLEGQRNRAIPLVVKGELQAVGEQWLHARVEVSRRVIVDHRLPERVPDGEARRRNTRGARYVHVPALVVERVGDADHAEGLTVGKTVLHPVAVVHSALTGDCH